MKLSLGVLVLAFLSGYGYLASTVTSDNLNKGVFVKPFKKFILFPRTIINVLTGSEIRGIPETYVLKDPTFHQINNLTYDVYGLNAFYNLQKKIWEIKLFNFRNDSIIYTWNLKRANYNRGKREIQYENAEPRNCILLPDRSLIASLGHTKNMYRLDKNSDIVWHNQSKLFHHSINLDSDGNIWTCSADLRTYLNSENDTLNFRDDYITKIDSSTGNIIFDKSVSELLIDNGYKNFVYGFSNDMNFSGETDPIHLNDIQPVLKDSEFWKKGDLFLSIRHRSLIILYRPKTNKIVRLIYGPFLNQHDVDIISDSEISIFNNNISLIGEKDKSYTDGFRLNKDNNDNLLNSEIIVYNFRDSIFKKSFENHFIEEKIITETEGFQELLINGDIYVESQNEGKIYIMNKNEIVLKKQFDTSIENMAERPHWLRIYNNINF